MNNELAPLDSGKLQTTDPTPSFLTIKQYVRKNPWISESGMRWKLFHSQTNGLESAIIRVGRRILIDSQAMELWLRSQKREVK